MNMLIVILSIYTHFPLITLLDLQKLGKRIPKSNYTYKKSCHLCYKNQKRTDNRYANIMTLLSFRKNSFRIIWRSFYAGNAIKHFTKNYFY